MFTPIYILASSPTLMDIRIVQYYRLCGIIPVTMPPYAGAPATTLEKIFTGKHLTIMLKERDGMFRPNETVIGGRPAASISVFSE